MARQRRLGELFRDLVRSTGGPSERLRAAMDALSPGLFSRVESFERRVREEFRRVESAEGPPDPQAEALVDLLYNYVREFEQRPGAPNPVRKVSVRFLRRAVSEVELALLPQRAKAFEILGVDRKESAQAIKNKYRELARRHHPDRPGGDHRKMQELNRAYEIVMRIKGVA